MRNIVLMMVIVVVLLSVSVFAQDDCPPPMTKREDIERTIKGHANVLTKAIGSGNFEYLYKKKENEVLSKYPNADKVFIDSYFLYILCKEIHKSENLKDKTDAIIRVRKAIYPEEGSLTPKSEEKRKEEETPRDMVVPGLLGQYYNLRSYALGF